jgi:uncharacterized protein (DUF983 family)
VVYEEEMPTPANIEAPILRVWHSNLERAYASAYKSECPACPDGTLLIYRFEGVLQRLDRCVSCGQRVFYLDTTVNGEPLVSYEPPN